MGYLRNRFSAFLFVFPQENNFRSGFILLLLALFPFSFPKISAQDVENIIFSPEQLQEDAWFFFSELSLSHPDKYYYCGLEIFEKKRTEIFKQLDRPMTKDEFMMILGTINSCLDAHSEIDVFLKGYLYRWIDLVSRSENLIFPQVYIKGNKLFTDIRGNQEELIFINGVNVQDIIAFIKQYIGKSTTRREEYILEGYFAVWAHTYFDIRPPFEVTYKKGNRSKETTLQGINIDEFKKFSCIFPAESKYDWIRYAVYPASSIAIFTINSFAMSRLNDIDLDETLKVFSDSIRNSNIRHLFIDVSKNGGGQRAIMLKLFNHIYHGTLGLSYVSFEQNTGQTVNNLYELNQEIFSLPNKNGFNGQLYVLQGVNTCSAADFFCKIVAQNKLGTLVGQNTGTPNKDFTTLMSTLLPHTKLPIGCATRFCDFSDSWDGESLAPDMLWDVDDTIKFSEEELKSIIEKWNKINK